jgi:hypothetical protein
LKAREQRHKEAMDRNPGWKRIKDQFGEDVTVELAGMPGLTPDTVTAQHIAQANRNIDLKKTTRAKAGAPSVVVGAAGVKWQPGEAEELAGSMGTLKALGELRQMITARPDLVGGPRGAYAKLQRVGEVLGVGSPEFSKIRAKAQIVASGLRRAMSGLAVVAHEGEYLKWIPDPLTQSGPELLANIEATEENTRRLLEHRVRIRQGDPSLPLLATPQGDVPLGEGAAATRPGGTPAPTGGRTADQEDARQDLRRRGLKVP